jgi:tetratricopeptide (TPR) repeat protein
MADAERVSRDLKAVAPDSPAAYQALGQFYLLTGQADKAVAEFRAVSTAKPKDIKVRKTLIGILLDRGRVAEAATLNQALLKASPGDPDGLLSDSRILISQGKFQQAQTEIEKVLKTDTQSASGYYFLGVAQNGLAFDKQAKASWARALELNPRMTIARIALADAAANHGDYDEALRQAGEILKTQPGLGGAHVIRARALVGKGNSKEAEAELQAVLDRDPTSLPALNILVNLRIKEGKPQTLVPIVSMLVEKNPKNAGLHFWQAVVYFRSNNLANAEASAKQAIALDPTGWEAYGLLAQIHTAQGSVEQARADLRSEIDRNPRGVKSYVDLERLYEKQGNWGEAKKLVERAHQIDPADPLVANNLAYLYLEHGGDVNFAVSLARDARQKVPDSPFAADTLGWAYYKLGNAKAAVTQLTDSVQKDPRNAIFQYHLGMAYLADGRSDLAKQSLRAALADDPHFPDAASARSALDKATKQQQTASKQ